MKQLEGFGKFLEVLRGKMSLREAANKSGLSHAYIRDLELERNRSTNDKIKPSPDTLKKLSEAYNFSYTDLMIKAGYLEKQRTKKSATPDIDLKEILFIEIEAKEIAYHTATAKLMRNVNSLIDFSGFLDLLDEHMFKKMDTNLFVNINHVQKYIEKEGKLFFDEQAQGKFVTLSALRQKKYHSLIVQTLASKNGTSLEYNYNRSSAKDSPLFFLKN
ncbi:helix-turn-helix domain-containing protein [Paenibacillus eucommiae]|uniref:Transcriptional regulator with XRE-family HTH domain n=1 Tax=Paenibacillus eucommiae TaxID=1355755 RepID=A0ABS4IP27_9BACL|nr:helix-turn-helix transcriptional regulator [Paenibacillus eucommiae]MBP1989313.1 transcriptional regulator with XRE-family HTH domain [Paenibacillus eucommiae]